MLKLNQRGVAHILLIILLLAGLGVAVYLVGQTTNIIPKAYEPKKTPLSAPVSPPPAFTCTACAADIVKSSRNRVDAQDNALLSSCFGKAPSDTLPGGKSCAPTDINKDGSINQTDVDCLKSVYFQSCTATPSPSATPDTAAKRVFVTFNQYTGNLGGLAGADTKCQGSANAASLGGTWKAWLSDSKTSASSRLTHANVSYRLLDGTVIANNWEDLTDGSLQNELSITEQGKAYYGGVRTGTQADGSSSGSNTDFTCLDWRADFNYLLGVFGSAVATNFQWTSSNSYSCSAQLALYCFEQ